MTAQPACPACAGRDIHTTVRDNGMIGGADPTLGLTALGEERWACPACGQQYHRRVEAAEPPYQFVDYDLYFFEKLEPVLAGVARAVAVGPGVVAAHGAGAEPPVYRCPVCGSLDVGRNAAKSAYDMTYMECVACGNGELVDWVERDAWVIVVQDQEAARVAGAAATEALLAAARVALAARALGGAAGAAGSDLGCVMCTGDDPEEAWEALQTEHVVSLVRELHFGVDVKRCFCDQLFAVVFTERIDFRDGEDDQTWLAVPITEAEHARIEEAGASDAPRVLVESVRQRRFLARTRLSEPPWWCDGGFSIFPHD